MLAAEDEWGIKAVADDADANSVYFCPSCGYRTILKRGTVRIAHFAHKPPISCGYGEGESPLHMRIKMSIYRDLLGLEGCANVDVECRFQGVVADVYAKIDGQPVAFEVQLSRVPLEEMVRRTEAYHRLGIAVAWIAHRDDFIPGDGGRYRVSLKERFLHTLYYGRVYYWARSGSLVYPVHFADVQSYRDSFDGPEGPVGGYFTTLKTEKRFLTRNNEAVSMASFQRKVRPLFSTPNLIYPNATIWSDPYTRWWE